MFFNVPVYIKGSFLLLFLRACFFFVTWGGVRKIIPRKKKRDALIPASTLICFALARMNAIEKIKRESINPVTAARRSTFITPTVSRSRGLGKPMDRSQSLPDTRASTFDYARRLKGKVVAFEGTPGNGKSTAIQQLRALIQKTCPDVRVVCLEEALNTELMAKFYEDRKGYAFPFQMAQMDNCLEVVLEATRITREDPNAIVFVERSPCGNRVFEEANRLLGNITQEEHVLYLQKWRDTVSKWVTHLNVLLVSDIDATLDRIRVRSRAGETIERDYIELLADLHEKEFLMGHEDCKCLAQPFTVKDSHANPTYYEEMLQFICENV